MIYINDITGTTVEVIQMRPILVTIYDREGCEDSKTFDSLQRAELWAEEQASWESCNYIIIKHDTGSIRIEGDYS